MDETRRAVIDRLRRLMPPPVTPTHAGTTGDWSAFESCLGVSRPSDYKEFITAYGAGSIDGYLVVYSPFAPNGLRELLVRLREEYAF